MPSGTLARRPAVLLALGLCAFGGVVTLLGRLAGGPTTEQKRVVLTSETGRQMFPSFSPDGQQVVYSAQPSGDEGLHIFVRSIKGGEARQLTTGDNHDVGPVWAPDGAHIAFLRTEEGRGQAILIPAAGGSERKIAEFDTPEDSDSTPSISWTRDGKSLAVTVGGGKQIPSIQLLSLQNGALRPITKPPEGSGGDSNPVISPDDKTLAFVRKSDEDHADVFLCNIDGSGQRQLSFDGNPVRGLAWSIAGQDVVYSSDRAGWRLWRLPAYGGSPREVLLAGNHASYPAIAPKGYRIAFTESPQVSAIWIAKLGSLDDQQERPAIRSASRESAAAWSPDGSKIATVSEQSGSPEIWVGSVTGGDRTQITRLESVRILNPRWSPDGNTILFETRGQNGANLYSVPAEGGRVTRLLSDTDGATWSPDGQSIFYSYRGTIWRANAKGSNAQQISHRFPSLDPEPSVDGKWIYYWSRGSIWRVPSDGGKDEEFITPERNLLRATMRATKTGLYYSEFDRAQRAMLIELYEFASAKSHPVLRVKDADFGMNIAISPDGRSVLYPKTDRRQTNLALLENFR